MRLGPVIHAGWLFTPSELDFPSFFWSDLTEVLGILRVLDRGVIE